MKTILMLMLAAAAAWAGTNEPVTVPPPAPLPAAWKLSPEAERLRNSPHFHTKVNELAGHMRNVAFLDTLPVAPRVEIALCRTVARNGSVTYSVAAVLGGRTAGEAVISATEPLEFLLDGHRYTCAPTGEPHTKSSVTSQHEETAIYECGEVLFRALAKSQRRQVRVHTPAGPLDKTLDATAAKRAEIFVRAFVEFSAR